MRRHILLYDPVRLAGGDRIHLFKLDRGALENELEAHEIAERLKERLRTGYRLPDVVIMEGEPTDNPRLFGANESVARIKSMLAAIAQHDWAPATLEGQSESKQTRPGTPVTGQAEQN